MSQSHHALSLRFRAAAILIATALISTPAIAQQGQGLRFQLFGSDSGKSADTTNVITLGSAANFIGFNLFDALSELVNTSFTHNGKTWNLLVKRSRLADSSAGFVITLNNEPITLDSTGRQTVEPPGGGPRIIVKRTKTALSVSLADTTKAQEWKSDLDPTWNKVAITLVPESELRKQVAQLREQLGRIEEKLRFYIAPLSDSAQVDEGFMMHTKFNDIKETLKQISIQLDAVK